MQTLQLDQHPVIPSEPSKLYSPHFAVFCVTQFLAVVPVGKFHRILQLDEEGTPIGFADFVGETAEACIELIQANSLVNPVALEGNVFEVAR